MKTEKDILFSIIIPSYNRAHMIGRAIESVLHQIYTNWELIIVDDGSEDETYTVVSSFSDERIKYFYQKNMGESVARNFGIERTGGAYICFLDDDDYYLPDFLFAFRKEIMGKNKAIACFMCDQAEELSDGTIVSPENKTKFKNNPPKFLFKYSNNFQAFCTAREILLKERFDERFSLGEDFHLMLRIALQYPFYYFPKTLCVYKIHDDMSTKNELDNCLFLELPANRLDLMDDLKNKYYRLLTKFGIVGEFTTRYNKTAYFYASAAMKNKRIGTSLKMMSKMKSIPLSGIIFYYYVSILLRIPYFFLFGKK